MKNVKIKKICLLILMIIVVLLIAYWVYLRLGATTLPVTEMVIK